MTSDYSPLGTVTPQPAAGSRWFVAIMGTVLQLCLGTIYAWSYLQKPLMEYAGWNNQQVAWILSLAICSLGLAAAVGGVLLPRTGPRVLAVAGVLLYATGWIVGGAALAAKNLALLYAGLGIVGGVGIGLGYVTPVATAAKWFPDKKGFVTGMVVMGFGLGALLLSKIVAPFFVELCTEMAGATKTTRWPVVFYWIAAALGVPGLVAALALRNPPATMVSANNAVVASDHGLTARACVLSARFALMWCVFFCNITAGIMFIGFQSPLLQDLMKARDAMLDAKALAAAGATLIAVSSVFNGIGRFFWGGLSDRIGRIQTFRAILGTQIAVFVALLLVKGPLLFGVLVCYILLCYGGGFGTAPSFVLTVFGGRTMAVAYGCLLTAWSMAGIVGPQVVAFFKDNNPTDAARYTFIVGAFILGVGLALSTLLDDKPFTRKQSN
jgi:OFA family oxalate/formate antiporter-like MFS transporter